MADDTIDKRQQQRELHRSLLHGVPAHWHDTFPRPNTERSSITEDRLRAAVDRLLEREPLLDYLAAHARRAAIERSREVVHQVPGQSREVLQVVEQALGNIGREPDQPSEYSEDGENLFAFYVLATAADAVSDDLA